MTTLDNITEQREEILRIARRHGARNVRLFGSIVRGDASPESDLDVLVELDEDRSLLDHVALKQDLEDLLGCEVDVVTEKALHRQLKDRIHGEAVPL